MATGRDADLFNDEALFDFEDPKSRRRRRHEATRIVDQPWSPPPEMEIPGDHPQP